MRRFGPGDPIFFRLKRPHHVIVGYGFFAHFTVLGLSTVWDTFAWRNGDSDRAEFLDRIGRYRGTDLRDPREWSALLGCTILRDVRFWGPDRWMPWGERMGWPRNTQQGRTETDPGRARVLLERITLDHIHTETRAEYGPQFEILPVDERWFREACLADREGQGTFRARILDAYGRRCAITGERTEPVLDAAHIQPYLGPRSNHVQNGLLLTKEFHTLFDEGFVTITPDYRVRVSPLLRERWRNGRRYYEYDDRPLAKVPDDPRHRPSRSALEWHHHRWFRS